MSDNNDTKRAGPVAATPLRVFIGFDPRQIVSYTAAQMSLIETASKPVAITPLVYQTLPMTRKGLTPFTWSRFLVPWLCGFEGQGLFVDADGYMRSDVADLFKLGEEAPDKAVLVSNECVGSYAFERAAVMLFNCGHPDNKKLTPEYVNSDETKGLHAIGWTEAIGSFPGDWNHLVHYQEPRPDARLVHFTQGVPAWPETVDSEHAPEWRETLQKCFTAQPWASLMGNSVHAQHVMARLEKSQSNGAAKPTENVAGVV